MNMAFEKVQVPSLTQSVVHAILGKILSGDLKAGDHLPPEREMAEKLGVSRSSVHLAVLELAGKGFLEIIPRRGTVVCDYRKQPTPDSLSLLMSYGSVELEQALFSDMMDTRLLLETESARLACTNIYESTFRKMQELVDALDQPNADAPDILYNFHYLLVQASGNSIYSMIFRGFESILRNLIALHYQIQSNDLPQAIQNHQKLLDAIQNKDEDLACQLTGQIITHGVNALATRYESGSNSPRT